MSKIAKIKKETNCRKTEKKNKIIFDIYFIYFSFVCVCARFGNIHVIVYTYEFNENVAEYFDLFSLTTSVLFTLFTGKIYLLRLQ